MSYSHAMTWDGVRAKFRNVFELIKASRRMGSGLIMMPMVLLLLVSCVLQLMVYLVGVSIGAVAVLLAGLFLLPVELFLRRFFPVDAVGTNDASVAPNAAVYGWGFPPSFAWRTKDPDSGVLLKHTTNDRGWKDVGHAFDKKEGVVRILIIGDSNTFGIVSNEQLYTRRLERMLHDKGCLAEVISMGYGGWGTDSALVALETEGLRYKPDIVINQFDTNDLTDNLSLSALVPGNKPFRFHVSDGQLSRSAPSDQHLPESYVGSQIYTLY